MKPIPHKSNQTRSMLLLTVVLFRTLILQVDYLRHPAVNQVVVMHNGTITARGRYSCTFGALAQAAGVLTHACAGNHWHTSSRTTHESHNWHGEDSFKCCTDVLGEDGNCAVNERQP